MKNTTIVELEEKHWPAVRSCLRRALDRHTATLDPSLPTWEQWDRKYHQRLRLGALANGTLAGWAGVYSASIREAYSGVGEVSIYVFPEYQKRGIGSLLLRHLVEASEREGYWTLQALVFPENEASLHLFRRAGFRTVGLREKLGRRPDGRWQDIILLERRSVVVD